jgi:hypothetical protein
MKIACRTLFDCSPTGTTGHFRVSDVPRQDRCSQAIVDQLTWNRSRNQQRNWETLLQIVQLRSQIDILQQPQRESDGWHWQFEVEQDSVYGQEFRALCEDGAGVPMILGLDEINTPGPVLITAGPGQNIWFQAINI